MRRHRHVPQRLPRSRRRLPPALDHARGCRSKRRVRAGHLEHRQDPARRRQAAGSTDHIGADAPSHSAQYGGTDGCARRSPTTLIVHISKDAPPLLETATAQPRDRRATRLRRTPPHNQAKRPRPAALTRRTLRLLRTTTRAAQRSSHCQYPGCTAARELEAHHVVPVALGGKTGSTPHPARPPSQAPARPPSTHAATASTPPSQTNPTRHHRQPATRTLADRRPALPAALDRWRATAPRRARPARGRATRPGRCRP